MTYDRCIEYRSLHKSLESPLDDAVYGDQNAAELGVAFNHDVAHYLVAL